MAKSSNFFGLRKGSTKTLTFSVLNGKQITKDRVLGGKNPRTLAQMKQRMVMNTVSAAYAQMKQIVDHSFQGITYGADTMAAFISENAKILKNDLNNQVAKFGYNCYRERRLSGGPWLMSNGKATQIKYSEIAALYQTNAGDFSGLCLSLSPSTQNGAISANRLMMLLGVSVGEMCTMCTIAPVRNSDTENFFAFVRLTFLKAGDVDLTSENYSEYILIESNLNIKSVMLPAADNYALGVCCEYSYNSTTDELPVCAIHSAQMNGIWTRSKTFMKVPQAYDLVWDPEQAIGTYPVGESYVLNGGEI